MRNLSDCVEEIPLPDLPKSSKPAETDICPIPRPLIDFASTPPDEEQTLLGDRFLCRKGGGCFIGQSGIGKSVGSAQQDILWSIGEPAFGIQPSKPLRILTIQAEDDDGDLSEMSSGIIRGLKLTDEQKALSRENCHYVTCRGYTGPEFLTKIVRPLLARGSYDLLRINPLQAYAGGDVKNTDITSAFLRSGLNPILDEFQIGNLTVHHTPKVTFRDTKEWKVGDWMYSGAGAADITNWARAILVIEATNDPRVFKFIAAKRGTRIGWTNDTTGEKEFVRYFAHGIEGLYWREATQQEITQADTSTKEHKPEELYELTPFHGTIAKDTLLTKATSKGISERAAGRFLKELIAGGRLFLHNIPRKGTGPEKHVARYEQIPA